MKRKHWACQIIEILKVESQNKHKAIALQLNINQMPLMVSSDALESLFGKFKTIVQRSMQAEFNRLIFFCRYCAARKQREKLAKH